MSFAGRNNVKKDDLGKDSLREQYEDALFKLLMDEFAEKEGQQLMEENENLKNDKELVLPDGLEARCEKTICNAFAVKHRKKTLQSAEKNLSRVAVIVLLCGVVFITLFSSVSAFRESVYKMLVNDEHLNTDVDLQESNVTYSPGSPIDVPSGAWLPAWLPAGYKMVSYEKNDINEANPECWISNTRSLR